MNEIIGAVVALSILVTIHEFGHFLAARFFGVKVEKFSIGFGPKIFSLRFFSTEFRFSLIPLGGYVKMKGENPQEDSSDEDSFQAKKWWKRASIAFAGPFFNLIFAAFVFFLSFAVGRSFQDHNPVIGQIDLQETEFQKMDKIVTVNENKINSWNDIVQNLNDAGQNRFLIWRKGEEQLLEKVDISAETWFEKIHPYAGTEIGEVAAGLPAYKTGLMIDDKIIAVDGQKVGDWYEMRELITESREETLELTIERDNKIFTRSIKPETNILDNNRIIGITQKLPLTIHQDYSFTESVKFGMYTTLNAVIVNYAALFKLAQKPSAIKDNLGGPVMIYTMSRQTAKKGIDDILSFIALISILLMVMNLLPIPILDGGHIIFCFIEGIFRKPLKRTTQMLLQKIGLFILILLMVFAFMNDFSRIFTRNISLNQQSEIGDQK